MRRAQVEVRGGRPRVVIADPEAAEAVAAVLEVWNRTRAYKGQVPDLSAGDVAGACRQLLALAQLLPPAETADDEGIRAAGELLTTAQVAQRLGLSERAVTYRIHTGALPATRVGRQWLIEAKDIANAHQDTPAA